MTNANEQQFDESPIDANQSESHRTTESDAAIPLVEDTPLYKCPQCGPNDLAIHMTYVRIDYFTASVSCNCGRADDAAVRSYHRDTACERHGLLDDSRHYQLENVEEIEHLGDEEDHYEVFCPKCVGEADSDDWEIHGPDDSEEADKNHACEWYALFFMPAARSQKMPTCLTTEPSFLVPQILSLWAISARECLPFVVW